MADRVFASLHILAKLERAPCACEFSTIRNILILYPNIKSHRSTGDHYLSTSTPLIIILLFGSACEFVFRVHRKKFIHRHQTQPNHDGRGWRQSTKRKRRWSEDKHGIATVQPPSKHFGTRERAGAKRLARHERRTDKSWRKIKYLWNSVLFVSFAFRFVCFSFNSVESI